MCGELLVTRVRTAHEQAHGIGARPAIYLRVHDLRVELYAECRRTIDEGLVLERAVARCQQIGAARKLETLAMPLIDALGERAEHATLINLLHGVIADFDAAMPAHLDTRTE